MLVTISQIVIGAADLCAAFLFLFGLKQMSSPATAHAGIRVAGIGMAAAVLASFFYLASVDEAAKPHMLVNLALAIVALAIGGGGAWAVGRKVAMTAMPQMVACYNGMGGGAAGSIAAVELFGGHTHGLTEVIVSLLGGLIGAVSMSGSVIAWAKLQGVMKTPFRVPGQQFANFAVLAVTVCVGGVVAASTLGLDPLDLGMQTWLWIFFGVATVFGIMMTLPIGGADMPVVISIFNAFTGLAVGLDGYVLKNPALMIAGMVVGAAGLFLTVLMAKAMNRSIGNVLFTNFGTPAKTGHGAIKGSERPTEASDAAIKMRYASTVIIIPGYGMAAAHAQGKLFEFVKLLVAAKVSVKFAIHPVAGRMPGQMDVLLAEAGVPYDMIFQLDDINAEFATTDVALVIGANDVVNPAARTDKASPIYGMPILNADMARQVYVIKRGQGKGYSGVVNALFYEPNTNMVYGDAQAVMVRMIEAVRGLGAAAA
jgi:NAD(P) transhydrogenase subunit beta